MGLLDSFTHFKSDPVATISEMQDHRLPWILMAAISLLMVIVAHSVFQVWLYMRPCEQCVYVRFAFFCMVFGGVVAALSPKNVVLKLVGYVFGFWGIIQGLRYNFKLNKIHHAAHSDDPFGVQGCSAEPTFPFNLPLDRWFPEWFKPTGDCGFDNPIIPDGTTLSTMQQALTDFYKDGWYLWPPTHFLNMAQVLLIVFGVCLVFLSVSAICWLITLLRKRHVTAATRLTEQPL
ncbi:protein-disulfide oxidoreductase DsbI [Trichlorobacter ammonificans]|uniref:Putative protein-disulfide oxidoreductase DsbI n=1 Tax=Trichlorobacter ammonificans TaxID=2916410 RepID=A0ABN8HKM6_9BACT|nr:protein-disulfide oxidoreductase DsbI [Trichlorobacter ammonificans]CAH2031757.1 Putative protein-disulfide oxidoreductase DsbI [Trichlorobacter ammonificans]